MTLSTSLRRLAVIGTAAALAAGALAGCSTSTGGGGGGDDEIIVGYSGYNVSNPFFAGLLKGLADGADANGFTLLTTNANGDANQQVTDVQNLITQGADYIAINPADGTAIAPAVAAATAAGVPVIALADSIASEDITFTIAPDQVEAGKQAGENMVEFLTEKYGEAKGNVVNIQGLVGTAAAGLRDEGFMGVISQYPNITVVATADGGWDTAPTNAVMTPILEANPEIDAVFGANDAEAIGVSAAIDAAGRFVPVGEDGHIYVIGVDGPKPAIDAIRAGVQDATVSQNPVAMAAKMMDLIADLEAGKTVDANQVWPVQYIDLKNIDSQEVKDYGIWADQV